MITFIFLLGFSVYVIGFSRMIKKMEPPVKEDRVFDRRL
jgi:hypothetical protein